jgi:hypothetical protein
VDDIVERENFEVIVDELLNNFYKRRIEKINTLKLKDALARKNPYLYKATGFENAADIIKEILSAYMSSSDEGIFGDAFFEVLAEKVSGGTVAESEGVDIIRQIDNIYQAIAVKSGTNVFNAASRKKQMENFRSLQSRIAKRGLAFQPIIGYGYGKKHTLGDGGVIELAGQVFWEELTGDSNFYIKIIELIGDKPQKHLPEYQAAFNAAVNRFTRDFTNDFCNEDSTINWKRLVDFNSGKPCKKLELNFNGNKTLSEDEEFQIEVTAILPDDTKENVTGLNVVTYEIAEGTEDVLLIRENGTVKFAPKVESGSKVKIIISSYGKTATRTFTLKRERKIQYK